ncbi:RNA-directed DNA polymerase, eukaryota [Tanacetum coccineum]
MKASAQSFFFTNFPESWGSSALWKMFNRYGNVVDVYIAFKRTKMGSSLPVIARNIGAVKAITNKFGKTLEIGRLDFDSKVLSPIKCLVLTSCMSTICQSLDVMVNKKIVSVRIFEKQFHASLFLQSDTTNANLFDEAKPSFEEEFIGPTVKEQEDEAEESCFMGNEFPPLQMTHDIPYVERDTSPCTSGLPPPPPYVTYPAQSSPGVDFVGPTPGSNTHGSNTHEPRNSPSPNPSQDRSMPDLNDPMSQPSRVVQEDEELDDLMASFQILSDNHEKNNINRDGTKRKAKKKNKNIIIGGDGASQKPVPQYDCSEVWGEDRTQSDPLDLVVPFAWCLSFLMNGISLNCNGLGQANKKSWVREREIIGCEAPIFFGIQESKSEEVDQFLIRSLWPRSHVDRAYSSSIGASSGIITMWDTRTFEVDCQFSNRNFLGVTGSWRGLSSKVGLLNVYAPQSSSLKEQLWSSIERVIADFDVTWIIFGDFKVVRSLDERMGSSFDVNEANTFNDFISRSGLCDLPLGGRRFIRFDKEGRKASKLDRFLVTSGFFNMWNGASVSVLCRSVSDHCPIRLKLGLPNFGPKPFKIFDTWIGSEGFHDLVLDSWATGLALRTSSNPHIVLKDMLKKLRMDIKAWTSVRIRDQNNSRDSLKNQLLEWDLKAEDGRISDHDIAKREECLMDLDHLDQIQRDDLKQKSRIKLAIEGDENTRFFHSILKINYCNSNIKGIMVNGIWQEDPDQVIKAAAFDHFSSQFKESRSSRPWF